MFSSGKALSTSARVTGVAGCRYERSSSAKRVTPSSAKDRCTSSSISSSIRTIAASPPAARRQRKALQASETNEVGAHGDRLDDVAPAADRPVDHDLGAAGGRVD